ncbi:MAG: hypothetical protein GC154_20910 [bacterium]|nr:hypothetical protein [bacterium]
MSNCPLCNASCSIISDPLIDGKKYSCDNDGEFSISGSAEPKVDKLTQIQKNYLRHIIFKRKSSNNPTSLTTTQIDSIIGHMNFPTPIEQCENLILWLGQQSQRPGEDIPMSSIQYLPAAGSQCDKSLGYIIEYLTNTKKLLIKRSEAYRLSMKGWGKYQELLKSHTSSKRVFMAYEFKNTDLKSLINNHLRKAILETGFELFVLDDEPKAGHIINRMTVEIRNSKFLIADQSDSNLNVYWEAGLAEGLNKPVIYICDESKKDKRPFDTNQLQTVFWNKDNPELFVQEIKISIRATFPDSAKMED